MIQVNAGSIWVGQKVMEKVREVNQTSQRQSFIVKLTMDKVRFFKLALVAYRSDVICFIKFMLQRVRWYTMTATPFLVFYIAGLIFSADTLILIKFVLIGCLYGIAHTIGKTMFDDHLMALLPLSIYMATKLWFYVTWIAYIADTVSAGTTMLFLASSGVLWYNFLKSWRGDPGIIWPTQEQRLRVSDISRYILIHRCDI